MLLFPFFIISLLVKNMMSDTFTVNCTRIKNKLKYSVKYPVNDFITKKIKEFPKEERSWNSASYSWELKAYTLFKLIKSFKGYNGIFFDFGDIENRNLFIKIIDKERIKEEEKLRKILELNDNKDIWIKYKNDLETNYLEHSEYVHSFLNKGVVLYPHQIVASLYLNKVRNALISHEMGLGKTLVSIIYAEINKFEKVVVITPNSLKFNYYYEVEKFTQSKAHILGWKGNVNTLEESKYIIFNYEFLNTGQKSSMDAKWKKLNLETIDCVISDESHRLKNPSSNTYKNYKRIFTEKIFRNENVSKVYLSGTPTPNKAHELYTVLNQISPIDFATKTYFYSHYCGMSYDTQGFGGWVTDIDDQKFEELYYKIAPYTHRKRKFEVLKDLPDKIYQKVMLEMDSSENKIYSDIERGIANEFSFDDNKLGITKLIRLRQYTSSLKVSVIHDLISDILDTGEKIVVVDFFKDSLYELKKKFGDIACLHTGDQTVEERAQMVKEFQNPNSKIKIFLGSIQTCNYGLTLTSSSKLFILSLPYSVGEYDQVSDRLHRISQKETVNIYPLIFRDSIDEWVFNAIEGKRKEINKVMDNEEYVSDVDESIISEVLNKLREKYK